MYNYVTFAELIQFATFIVALISLFLQFRNK